MKLAEQNILIMNKYWSVSELMQIADTDVNIISNVEDYEKDPNCRAWDWIISEDLTEIQKAAFIYQINHRK